jgi:membrane protease YdiL (CAAX protease family)
VALTSCRERAANWGAAAFFIACIVFVQLAGQPIFGAGLCAIAALVWIALPKRLKPFGSMVLAAAAGFYASEWLSGWIKAAVKLFSASEELAAALSRLSLAGYVLPLALTVRLYELKPKLLAAGRLPGRNGAFQGDSGGMKQVWLSFWIALVANAAVFGFLADWRELAGRPLFWYACGLLFALLNSSLETVIWRGLALSRCIGAFGRFGGIAVSGIAFGLYHYSFTGSWPLCLFFGAGGVYFGWLAWRCGGLLAPWLLHFALNVLFVIGGMIF